MELLVALPIVGIIGTLAVLLLIATQRQARRADDLDGAVRELRHAAVILGAELRPLRAADLVAWSDTSIEFQSLVGTGVACGTRTLGAFVNLLPAGDSDPLDTRWIMPLQDGDQVRGMLAPATAGVAVAWESFATSVSSTPACAGSPLASGSGSSMHVALDAAPPTQFVEGTPVRVTRRTRYYLYRASDGRWYLGRAARGRTVWEGVQPVAGPFASPALRGVRFTVRDSAGNALAGTPSTTAASVHVELRAARPGTTTVADSSFVAIALRGRDE